MAAWRWQRQWGFLALPGLNIRTDGNIMLAITFMNHPPCDPLYKQKLGIRMQPYLKMLQARHCSTSSWSVLGLGQGRALNTRVPRHLDHGEKSSLPRPRCKLQRMRFGKSPALHNVAIACTCSKSLPLGLRTNCQKQLSFPSTLAIPLSESEAASFGVLPPCKVGSADHDPDAHAWYAHKSKTKWMKCN